MLNTERTLSPMSFKAGRTTQSNANDLISSFGKIIMFSMARNKCQVVNFRAVAGTCWLHHFIYFIVMFRLYINKEIRVPSTIYVPSLGLWCPEMGINGEKERERNKN